jgi:hypothetical protein
LRRNLTAFPPLVSVFIRIKHARNHRSAELHLALSPIFNRQGFQIAGAFGIFPRAAEFNSAMPQIKNPCYTPRNISLTARRTLAYAERVIQS